MFIRKFANACVNFVVWYRMSTSYAICNALSISVQHAIRRLCACYRHLLHPKASLFFLPIRLVELIKCKKLVSREPLSSGFPTRSDTSQTVHYRLEMFALGSTKIVISMKRK